jgi:hypothetical protein
MNYNIDYLLKYVSNENYNNIIKKKSPYLLELLEKNRIDVDLNIRYLIKYGISKIDEVVFDRVEDLVKSHNDFIKTIHEYEKKLGKEKTINMLENL